MDGGFTATPFTPIEEALAGHPVFAEPGYILDRLHLAFSHRLQRIASRMPVAGALQEALAARGSALHRVYGDTIVRCAVLHAHTQIESGAPYGLPLETCEAILAATLAHLEAGRSDTPLQDGTLHPAGALPQSGLVWSGAEHADDLFGRTFCKLVGEHYGALPVVPSERERAMLDRGVALLRRLLPALTPSALIHANLIALIPSAGGWSGTASGSQFRLGGTVFLSHTLGSPWWVAEHLLHEALHQKLYDFRQAHSLLELDTSLRESPRIWSPWNPQRLHKANQWDISRVLAAFHVYVYLSLMTQLAEQSAAGLEAEFGPLTGMLESRKALSRAHYLGEQLQDHCREELGAAGQRMVDWLMDVLACLDPAPPPKGATIHLCLDLYAREANQVAQALAGQRPAPPNLADTLAPLARQEAEGVRAVLTSIAAKPALADLEARVAEWTDADYGSRFAELRLAIRTALLDATGDGYRLGPDGAQDSAVHALLEDGSLALYTALSGLPPAVADARRRAGELHFGNSCEDDVGRTLAILAAAVPPGGRVLEIGTGAGVGLAWILTGLGKRGDVEVISIEADATLAAGLASHPWPPFVRLETVDAAAALPGLGSFNLVFADAAPHKYEGMEAVIAALRPGGQLIIDDVSVSPRTQPPQREAIAALRRTILGHPALLAVELAWATGVLIAARRHG